MCIILNFVPPFIFCGAQLHVFTMLPEIASDRKRV